MSHVPHESLYIRERSNFSKSYGLYIGRRAQNFFKTNSLRELELKKSLKSLYFKGCPHTGESPEFSSFPKASLCS